MNEKLIFILLMFAATICYGQRRQSTVSSPLTIGGYKGITFYVINHNYKNKDGEYYWGIMAKNSYLEPVTFRYRLIVGGTYSARGAWGLTSNLAPGASHYDGNDLFTAMLYKTEATNYTIEIKDVKVGGKLVDANGNIINENNAPKNANNIDEADPDAGLSIKEQYLKYREKRYSLCETIRKLDKQSRYSMDVRFPCNTQSTPIENPSRDDVEKYKREIAIIEKAIEELSVSNADVGQNNIEEERRQTEMQSKMDRYNSLMTQGSEAFASEDYSAAMTYYSQAKTTALTDEQRNYADEMYQKAFEAKKTAERAERVAHQKKVDDAENIGYVSAAASTITLMSLINDSPSLGFTSGKLLLGLNFGKLPLISNNVSAYHANKSYIEAPLMPGFDFGFNFGIANNKSVSLYLNPKFSYGLDAFSEGTSGYTMEYGGTALLRISFKKYGDEAGVKPYLEGGYFRRNGSYHYDGDAVNQSVGVSSSTDDVRDGDYKYTVIRYGGGLMYHWKDEDEEYMVRGGVFFDKPSFFPKDIKPVLGFNVQGMISYVGTLEFYFAPNYFVGGNLLYPATLEKKNKSYLGIKFTRAGKLW